MGTAKLEVVNNALVELGDEVLTSLSENKLSVTVANQVYDDVYEDLLGKAPWRFAMQKADLSRDTDTPLNEWTYQYTLPAQCLRILRVYPDQAYEVYGLKLYAHAPSLAVDYVEKVSESYLPPPFVRLLSLELAARMCMAITNDAQLKVSLQNDARMQFAAALSSDAMQRPNKVLRTSPFIAVRG